jgi:hypothetical protein
MALPLFPDSLTVIDTYKKLPYKGSEPAEDKISVCESQNDEGTRKIQE